MNSLGYCQSLGSQPLHCTGEQYHAQALNLHTCANHFVLSIPDPLTRINHQLLLPTRAHTVCHYYKKYSTLLHFSCVSLPQDELCLRPCHSSCVLHELCTISEAQRVLTWCVLNSFNCCLLSSHRNDLTPARKLPGAIVLILFWFIPLLEKVIKAMHLYHIKVQKPIKIYILL